jgi:D-psicose/D-tagatose/L-ribulose 3-epimerase
VEVQRAAAAHAQQAGVKLSVEPLNRFEVYFLNSMADANRLAAEVDNPFYGYLYDSFHANIEEADVYRSVVDNAAGINHVHISENHRGTPGSGHVHWADTFRALKAINYDGWLTIEAFGRALPELAAATCIWRDLFDSADNLASEGLAFMKGQWEAA